MGLIRRSGLVFLIFFLKIKLKSGNNESNQYVHQGRMCSVGGSNEHSFIFSEAQGSDFMANSTDRTFKQILF